MHLGLRTVGGKALQQRPDTPALERVCEGLTDGVSARLVAASDQRTKGTDEGGEGTKLVLYAG